ncbi:MAG: endonuclease/exonuclease/phosphatase family protein [Planctomycetaceae bacterium]|nr:endonuclease/exonuclease/phosphatase family protein [Planctomycetaceae bacterium]
MPARIETFFLHLRNTYSRARLLVRILGLSRSPGDPQSAGLVLIQIDALSKKQLNAALAAGRMPFLKSLIQKEEYHLHSWYSGIPPSTPVVQAELLYGIKQSMVSFSFRDHVLGRAFVMYNPQHAAEMEDRLSLQGRPLLSGGSAYSDIFTGGADETHFCIATLGAAGFFKNRYPLVLILLHAYSLLRTALLMVVETGLAVYDFFVGLIQGQDLWKELKFVPSRVVMCTLLRELIVIGAGIDVARGLPVIHMNFMGYHEQSHRRGAASLFAHWTLRGIDDAVRRVLNAAQRSTARDYSVWLYSDHGQVDTVPYARQSANTIQHAVAEALKSVLAAPLADIKPVTEALGPMGHIYIGSSLPPDQHGAIAGQLLRAGIPAVCIRQSEDHVLVWTREGAFTLPEEAPRLLDSSVPFYQEMLDDFMALFNHPDCGDIVILGGYRGQKEYFSFALENGAHGGITSEEAEGFALLPAEIWPCSLEKGYLRPLDLHNHALCLLKQESCPVDRSAAAASPSNVLRVMTYNVHGCLGMDGCLSPGRIARVISQYKPHIVALQELDVGSKPSGGQEQASLIARYLNMSHHFHPGLQVQEEPFGNAVLSAVPLALYKTGPLMRHPMLSFLEPRGAIWVQAELNGRLIQVINTHLGLLRQERIMHAEELLGPDWLSHPDCKPPIILCGAFNALPGSRVIELLQARLNSFRDSIPRVRHRGTWFGRYPLMRLDHIFIGPGCRIIRIEVCDSYLARLASDHRPLLAEIEIV